jgi:hypothetical protein
MNVYAAAVRKGCESGGNVVVAEGLQQLFKFREQAMVYFRLANSLDQEYRLFIRSQQRTGPRLVAFFGCLYFAGLRPEEAVSLTRDNLAIPESGWGELHLSTAEPHAGKE